MRLLPLLLLLITCQVFAQNEFAPYGAEWKYTYHRFVNDFEYNCDYNICDQDFGSLMVVDTTQIDGRDVSILWQGADSDSIYIHSRNDSVFFYAVGEFHLLYDFTVNDGDTIDVSVPTFYEGPGSLNAFYHNEVDSVRNIRVVVEERPPVLVGGEVRKVFYYQDITGDVIIPNVIDGIGSGEAFFGFEGGFVAEGCFGFFICYEDKDQNFTPFGCCDYPEPFPARKFAPLGAEWLYEGWSGGTPNTSGCIDYCEGNYNLFKVEGERDFAGRNHAVVNRYHKTKDSDWEFTGDVIYLYDFDGGFYAHQGFIEFANTYRTDVVIDDVIKLHAVNSYPKWIGNDTYTYPDLAIVADQKVKNVEIIDIDGQMRKKISYQALDNFQIGTVIEGIGPLHHGLLGSNIPIPASGCGPRLICYKDAQITFTTDDDCGCEFPMGPNSVNNIDPSTISISPNPVNNVLTIWNDSNINFISLEILDLTGKVILESDYNNIVDVSSLSQGLYLIVFEGDEGRLVKKIVKN